MYLSDEIEIISTIMFVLGIFQIVLFFKLWRMTDNVSKIRKTIEMHYKSDVKDILVGDIVQERKTQKKFSVVRTVGKRHFECKEMNGDTLCILNKDDIKLICK